MGRDWIMLGLAAWVAACDKGATAPKPPKDVVAWVNGKPITATEVELRRMGRARPGVERATPETPEEALEALVLQELQAQRALELGLDNDESFQLAQQKAEAQLREVRRRELAKLYRSKELLDKIVVTEDEARRYFEANHARVKAELKVHQLILKGRPAADAAAAAIAQGKPFEEVAAAQLSVLPPGDKPWELPPLSWEQVPSQWWDAIDKLNEGQVTAPIAGPDDRFWIIKLIQRTENPAVTLEVALPKVQAMVKSDKFEQRRDQLDQQLVQKARVQRLPPIAQPAIPAP